MLEQLRSELDFAYLRRWVTDLRLEDQWTRLGEPWPDKDGRE